MLKQLRVFGTLLLAFALAQAGLGSGYLDEVKPLLIAHATNAFAVVVISVLATVFGFYFRRAGGSAWAFFLPLGIVIECGVQMTLGFSKVLGFHVFWGVLTLCTITVYCSYAWREKTPPAGAAAAGAGRATVKSSGASAKVGQGASSASVGKSPTVGAASSAPSRSTTTIPSTPASGAAPGAPSTTVGGSASPADPSSGSGSGATLTPPAAKPDDTEPKRRTLL